VSLLEAVVATVILALVGVACLAGTQRALALQQRAEQRAVALQQAESELTAMVLRVDVRETAQSVSLPKDVWRQTYRPAWAASTPLPIERVTVQVEMADGRVMQLSRLVPQASARSSAASLAQP
jgi:Tfp pilus assembly protein PilV